MCIVFEDKQRDINPLQQN